MAGFITLARNADRCVGIVLAALDGYETLQHQMETTLAEWMERTDDPFCHGPVSPPEGGYTDPQDALHPK